MSYLAETFHTPASLMRTAGNRVDFRDVPINNYFECNGNVWIKRTARTATGFWPACLPNVAYFRRLESCYMESK